MDHKYHPLLALLDDKEDDHTDRNESNRTTSLLLSASGVTLLLTAPPAMAPTLEPDELPPLLWPLLLLLSVFFAVPKSRAQLGSLRSATSPAEGAHLRAE